MTDELDRTPPHDAGAEQRALGGMLLSAAAVGEVADITTTRDFYQPPHATIFNVILDLYSRGEPTDTVSIAARLAETGDLARIGGATYLHTLVEAAPTAANAGYYAHIVRRRAVRRRLIEAGTRIVQVGYNTDDEDNDIADRAAQVLHDATVERVTGELTSVGDLTKGFLDALETGQQQGLSTGLTDLDMLLGGLQPGTVTVVAGRPGTGKSVCLADFARAAGLRQRQTTVYFTIEMRKMQLLRRIYAAEARVPLRLLKQGGKALSDDDWTRVTKVAGEIGDAPLYIEDRSSLSITDVAAITRRLAQRNALGLILVDYLQLMEGMAGRSNDNREREVARISRGLKVLAADLHVPIVVAAQLNRGPEQRTDKRPMLSDLRESGAIENDADVVILLHRPDYYDKESERAGEVDLIVAKHRDGETDTVTAAAQLHFSRFMDMALPADSFYANVAAHAAAA